MPWDPSRFEAFIEATVQMAQGELPGYGHPHVILPYAEHDEINCIESLRAMPSVLHVRGLESVAVSVAQVVAEVMRRYAAETFSDVAGCARMESDLGDPRDGLARRVARRLNKQLAAKTQVLVLGRLGALHPFASVSGLLDALHREGARITVAAAYPGTSEGVALRFLGVTEPHGGYRGHVVT